ncbi:MAG TPA: hypothetical protein VJ835_09160 [Fimbriimonadaceae bacterium]|nr:hypothetical protein [Fimbriimonadaceae bacterium]
MRFKQVLIFGCGAAALFALPIVASKATQWISENSVHKAEEHAKAAGVAVAPEDALAGYQNPEDKDNAAEAVKSILRKLSLPPTNEEFQPSWKSPYKESEAAVGKWQAKAFKRNIQTNLDELEGPVRDFQAVLKEFDVAVLRPGWNFHRKWNEGAAMLLPDAARIKQLVRMLYARALLAARDHNIPLVRKSFETMLKVGDHLMTEPLLICQMVGISCHRTAYTGAVDCMRVAPSPELGKALQELLEKPCPVEMDWHRTWQMEFASQLASLELFTSEDGLTKLGIKRKDKVATRSQRSLNETRSRVLDQLSFAEMEWKSRPNNAQTAEEMNRKYGDQIYEILYSYSDVLGMLSGPQESSTVPPKVTDARRRLAYVAIAIVLEGQKSGKLPPAGLRKDMQDPFGSGPLRLSWQRRGFTLYSLGENGADDGGNENGTEEDIVMRFPFRD